MPAPASSDAARRAPWRPSRREFLVVTGLGLLGAACSSGSNNDHQVSPTAPASPTPAAQQGSLDDLSKGTAQMSVLSGNEPIAPGQVGFSFALADSKGGLITGGSPQVWAAQDQTSKATGPVSATWYEFTGYEATGDHSPKSPIPGTYVATIQLDTPGNWVVGVLAQGGNVNSFGTAAQPVANGLPNQAGSKATSVQTPVATTDAAISEICTRNPVDHLHAISLDKALTNGKPTVVVFSTPLLCQSQLCGPVTDEVILVSDKHGTKANFIHVEEFLPGPSHSPPVPSLDTRSPGFKAWKLESEPFVYVIDSKGVIRAAFGPGPSTAPQIEAALTPRL
jgi:hypothetical protein